MKQSILLLILSWTLAGCSQIFNDYSKVWFQGRDKAIVCKKPYSNNNDCSNLVVYSNGKSIDTIYFPNGGLIEAVDSDCAEAASFYSFKTICSLQDKDGNEWDILPLGSNF